MNINGPSFALLTLLSLTLLVSGCSNSYKLMSKNATLTCSAKPSINNISLDYYSHIEKIKKSARPSCLTSNSKHNKIFAEYTQSTYSAARSAFFLETDLFGKLPTSNISLSDILFSLIILDSRDYPSSTNSESEPTTNSALSEKIIPWLLSYSEITGENTYIFKFAQLYHQWKNDLDITQEDVAEIRQDVEKRFELERDILTKEQYAFILLFLNDIYAIDSSEGYENTFSKKLGLYPFFIYHPLRKYYFGNNGTAAPWVDITELDKLYSKDIMEIALQSGDAQNRILLLKEAAKRGQPKALRLLAKAVVDQYDSTKSCILYSQNVEEIMDSWTHMEQRASTIIKRGFDEMELYLNQKFNKIHRKCSQALLKDEKWNTILTTKMDQ